jgi:hypothetical protein
MGLYTAVQSASPLGCNINLLNTKMSLNGYMDTLLSIYNLMNQYRQICAVSSVIIHEKEQRIQVNACGKTPNQSFLHTSFTG